MRGADVTAGSACGHGRISAPFRAWLDLHGTAPRSKGWLLRRNFGRGWSRRAWTCGRSSALWIECSWRRISRRSFVVCRSSMRILVKRFGCSTNLQGSSIWRPWHGIRWHPWIEYPRHARRSLRCSTLPHEPNSGLAFKRRGACSLQRTPTSTFPAETLPRNRPQIQPSFPGRPLPMTIGCSRLSWFTTAALKSS